VTGYLRANRAEEPEDLASEVFLHVVDGLERFRGGEADFRAWVFTIAHRRLVDDVRRRARRPRPASGEHSTAETMAVGGDVGDEAMRALEDEAVRAAIDELAPDQRAVLLLRILGDLTIEQIARALRKRPGAVKALQRRALRRIERAYPFERRRR
jgi:RNA polymerase sigma factor (sigma-70 family)